MLCLVLTGGVDLVVLSKATIEAGGGKSGPSVVGTRLIYVGVDRESMCRSLAAGGTKWCPALDCTMESHRDGAKFSPDEGLYVCGL